MNKTLLIVIEAFSYTARTTIGKMYLQYDDKRMFFGYTLEDTLRPGDVKVYGETAIPRGTECDVSIYTSLKFGKTIMFHNEPDKVTIRSGLLTFKYVEVHGGNSHSDTSSCVLVARNLIDADTIQGSLQKELCTFVEEKINEGYKVKALFTYLPQKDHSILNDKATMNKKSWKILVAVAILLLIGILIAIYVIKRVEQSKLIAGAAYYVATTGNDNNPGTLSQPFATWEKGIAAAGAGDIVWIRGGVYNASQTLKINKKGSDTIRIFAYPGEKPILDFLGMQSSGTRYGIVVTGSDLLWFNGLAVRNLTEYSASYYGVPWETINSTNILYENCSVSNSSGGWTCEGTSDRIKWLNCDVYSVNDKVDRGGYANGFSANIDPGKRIEYQNCRAWDCSDDGFDMFASAGYITINGCWTWDNGTGLYGNGNGVGIKTGANKIGKEPGIQRTITNNLVFNNTLIAFDESADVSAGGFKMEQVWYNNTSFNNAELHSFRSSAPPDRIFRNNISFNDKANYSWGSGMTIDHNSWQGLITSDDFVSIIPTGVDAPRKPDGSLPDIDFMKLKPTSKLVDAGVDVGLPYKGTAPDLGAFERFVPPEPPICDTIFVHDTVYINPPDTVYLNVREGTKVIINLN